MVSKLSDSRFYYTLSVRVESITLYWIKLTLERRRCIHVPLHLFCLFISQCVFGIYSGRILWFLTSISSISTNSTDQEQIHCERWKVNWKQNCFLKAFLLGAMLLMFFVNATGFLRVAILSAKNYTQTW